MVNIGNTKDLSAGVIQRPSLLQPENVGVVYNVNDANSTEIANYYLSARNIPAKNLIPVSLPVNGKADISAEDFAKLKLKIDQLSDNIQVIVLMWKTPYAMNCNSITSALTLGYDAKQCENGCGVGKPNLYFNSASQMPYRDFKIRPSMLIPTDSIPHAKALIDRGVLSGFNLNDATGYFLKTNDAARSRPREEFFPQDLSTINVKKLHFRTMVADTLKDKKNIMFYFTGAAEVMNLETLSFLPGAVGDHLTSYGGALGNNQQMSINKWLDAGATGSYGTVSEPCNYWQKFPNPRVMVSHYIAGETLIEAYWKSVAWPAQGLFIGEPLAAPYKKIDLSVLTNNEQTPDQPQVNTTNDPTKSEQTP